MAKGRGDELGETVIKSKLQFMRFEDLEEDFEFGPVPNGNPEDAFDAPEENDDLPF